MSDYLVVKHEISPTHPLKYTVLFSQMTTKFYKYNSVKSKECVPIKLS